MLELAKYAKQHIPEQHPKVRGVRLVAALRSCGVLQENVWV